MRGDEAGGIEKLLKITNKAMPLSVMHPYTLTPFGLLRKMRVGSSSQHE